MDMKGKDSGQGRKILLLLLIALSFCAVIVFLEDRVLSQPPPEPPPPGLGDGYLLRRSPDEMCHGCHRTDKNTPAYSGESGFSESYSETNWNNAIKTHSSDYIGTCSVSGYTNKRACINAGGTWTPRTWSASGGWGVSGGKYGEFTCRTCHTSHNTANIYLIKETIRSPNSPTDEFPGSAVDFRKMSGTVGEIGLMGDDTGGHETSSRVCEVCHSQNAFHNYNTANNTGGLTHQNATNCASCHGHKRAFKEAHCSDCHGPSPSAIAGAHGAHFGGTWEEAAYGNDSRISTSATYKYNCGNCHPLNSAKHSDGTKDIELYNSNATGFKANNPSSASRSGTGNNTVCSDVYCHSNGRAVGAGRVYVNTPQWGSTFTGNKCAGCHNDPPRYATREEAIAAQDSHYIAGGYSGDDSLEGGHLISIHNTGHGTANATTISCNICHVGTVNWTALSQFSLRTLEGTTSGFRCVQSGCHGTLQTGTITDKSKHVNAARDVAFAQGDYRYLEGDGTRRFRSDAQLSEVPAGWTRMNGYDKTTERLDTTFRGNLVSYTPATKTCSNIACHLDNTSIQWGGWGASMDETCQRCHPL